MDYWRKKKSRDFFYSLAVDWMEADLNCELVVNCKEGAGFKRPKYLEKYVTPSKFIVLLEDPVMMF